MFSDAAVVAGLSFPFCDLFLCDVVSSCFRHVVVEGPFWVRTPSGGRAGCSSGLRFVASLGDRTESS